MSTKLIVSNLPARVSQEEIKDLFKDFKGYQSVHIYQSQQGNQAEISFLTLEDANAAKQHRQNYMFPNTYQAILIDIHPTEFFAQQQYFYQQGLPAQSQLPPNNYIQNQIPSQLYTQNNATSAPNYPYQAGYPQNFYPPSNPIAPYQSQQPVSQNTGSQMGFQQDPQNKMFKVPSDANKSLYVDGVPIDSNEREVAHIFRPFPGFENVKLIKKQSHSGREFYYCFVEFENTIQSTIALVTLQGYRFDKNKSDSLRITYAKGVENKDRNNSRNNNNYGSTNNYNNSYNNNRNRNQSGKRYNNK